jgi:transposase-like protein
MSKQDRQTEKTIRTFSEEFKRLRVKELQANKISIAEMSRLYKVSKTSIYNWLELYGTATKPTNHVVVEELAEAKKTLYWQQRAADLERIIGQKQLHIDYLEKLIETAQDELKCDLKKTSVFNPTLVL